MRKLLRAALLAAVSVPAHATYDVAIQGTFASVLNFGAGAETAPVNFAVRFAFDAPEILPLGYTWATGTIDVMEVGGYSFATQQLAEMLTHNGGSYGIHGYGWTLDGSLMEVRLYYDPGGVLSSGAFARVYKPGYGASWMQGSITSSSIDPVLLVFAPDVPEPATWTMLVGGFALVGAGMRARKTESLCA